MSSVQCQASLLPTVTTRNRRQQRKQGSKLDMENRQLRPRKQMYYESVSPMLLHFKLRVGCAGCLAGGWWPGCCIPRLIDWKHQDQNQQVTAQHTPADTTKDSQDSCALWLMVMWPVNGSVTGNWSQTRLYCGSARLPVSILVLVTLETGPPTPRQHILASVGG